MRKHLFSNTGSKLLALTAFLATPMALAGTRDNQLFSQPAPQLQAADRTAFSIGSKIFHEGVARMPAGVLGPHFSATACAGCHISDGRGTAYAPARPPVVEAAPGFVDTSPALLLKLAPTDKPGNEPYGAQITLRAVRGVAARGRPQLAYVPLQGQFADGQHYTLRRPVYRVVDAAYGPLAAGTILSARLAPQMVGLGLLDAIPEEDIVELARLQNQRAGPIRGQVSRVWDPIEEKFSVGRFGWKAGAASLHHQTGLALQQDMGVTAARFSGAECPPATPCRTPAPEMNDAAFLHLLDYQFGLALPVRPSPSPSEPARLRQGAQLFEQAACGACHRSDWTTGKGWFPGMSRRAIRPFTDLLLHDMGDALSDRRLDGALLTAASDGAPTVLAARQWRTAPLWGLGLIPRVNGHQQLLHDGRARGVLEAILWHGGEAETAQRVVLGMTLEQRDALVAFVNSL